MTVKCRSPVLIPRPETEELVDYILKSSVLQSLTNMSKNLKPRLLDVGAGSGVIGLALLNNIPRAECIALDINDDAVQLANENAKLVLKYSDRYQCLNSSFMNFVQSAILKMGSTSQLNEDNNSPLFDIIISNPPYIPTADVAELQTEVRDWEDIRALDGGLDGLDMIKDLIRHSPSLMRPEGTRELWMEVSHLHPEVIQNWVINEKIRVELVETWNDLSGQPRFVRIRYIL